MSPRSARSLARRAMAAALGGLLALAALAAAPSAGAQDVTGPATFADLGLGTRSVRGIHATTSYFFPLRPGDAVGGPPSLALDVSHSPLLRGDRSTVTVAAGGVSLASAPLTPATAAGQRLGITVPPDLVGDDGLFVEVRFYLRATDSDCEDPTNPALWATVHSTSTMALQAAGGPRDLADLEALLTPRRPTEPGPQVVVAEPDRPEVLEAAGAVAWQLGRWAATARLDALVTLGSPDARAPGEGPTVVVGRADEVTPPLPDDVDADERATLALGQEGPTVLWVTGPDAAAVRRAGHAMAADGTRGALAGPAVGLGEERAARAPERTAPWTGSAASFAQLGLDRHVVSGPGRHVLDLPADRPPGWRLEDDAVLQLDLDVGAGLRDTSSVRATASGVDLGTRSLGPAQGLQRLRFEVPGSLLDRRLDGGAVRGLALQLTFQLAPDLAACTPLDADAASVAVLPTSSWTLPHEHADDLDLGRFPHPLAAAGEEARPTVVVLPEGPDDTTLTAGLQVVAALGRWAPPGAPVPLLVTADQAAELVEDHDLVLLGDADDALGETIDAGTGAVALTEGETVAHLALVTSPFGRYRTALAVQGDGPALLLAARALAGQSTTADLQGQRAVLVGDVPQALDAARGGAPPPALAPVAQEDEDRQRWLVGGVLLAGFVVVITAGIWFRWLRPRRRRG